MKLLSTFWKTKEFGRNAPSVQTRSEIFLPDRTPLPPPPTNRHCFFNYWNPDKKNKNSFCNSMFFFSCFSLPIHFFFSGNVAKKTNKTKNKTQSNISSFSFWFAQFSSSFYCRFRWWKQTKKKTQTKPLPFRAETLPPVKRKSTPGSHIVFFPNNFNLIVSLFFFIFYYYSIFHFVVDVIVCLVIQHSYTKTF